MGTVWQMLHWNVSLIIRRRAIGIGLLADNDIMSSTLFLMSVMSRFIVSRQSSFLPLFLFGSESSSSSSSVCFDDVEQSVELLFRTAYIFLLGDFQKARPAN